MITLFFCFRLKRYICVDSIPEMSRRTVESLNIRMVDFLRKILSNMRKQFLAIQFNKNIISARVNYHLPPTTLAQAPFRNCLAIIIMLSLSYFSSSTFMLIVKHPHCNKLEVNEIIITYHETVENRKA